MRWILLCSLTSLVLTTCNVGIVEREALTPTPSGVVSTATVTSTLAPTVAPTATATSTPTSTPPLPAPEATPTTAPEREPTRIQFAPGAISAQAQGRLVANGEDRYVIQALAGQTMMATLSLPPEQAGKREVIMVIWGADGVPLITDHALTAAWEGLLPATQDYFIEVRSIAPTAVDYTLKVVIPPPVPDATPTFAAPVSPTRIQFPAGSTSVSVENRQIAANGVDAYVLRALEGQRMSVGVYPWPNTDVALSIYGAENGMLLLQADLGLAHWSGNLPATQDYVVRIVNYGAATNYTLQVTIPWRITFDPGATSVTLEGSIVGQEGVNEYVLHARADQTMTVAITSPNNNVWLTIVGSDGIPLVRSHMGQTSWTDVLQVTQDYTILAVMHQGATSPTTNYTLQISITD